MKVFAIGASRNIGYYSCLHLLNAGHVIVFQLRSLTAFDNDQAMQPFVRSGKAILIKGDALNKQDVENAWKAANQGNPIDLVLFTVGGTPKFNLTKGLVISPPNLTTHSLSNVLQTIAASNPNPMPRMIAVTSTGVTKSSHDHLPVAMKAFYSYGLRSPHADKLGMERLLQHAMGMAWTENVEPVQEVLQAGWENEFPPAGWLPNLVIVRPARLTDAIDTRHPPTSSARI